MNGLKATMSGMNATYKIVNTEGGVTGAEIGNVHRQEFGKPESYQEFSGARSLESFTKSLFAEGFGDILRRGRSQAAPLFQDANGKATLRSLRMAAGLNQSELAKMVGIQQYQVSKYESGRIKPDYQTMSKMIDVLKIDANTLFEALS